MEIGSIVVMNNSNIIYIIEDIVSIDKVYISGVHYRIRRIISLDMLRLATNDEIDKENKKSKDYFLSLTNIKNRSKKKYLLGTVLHIDGDTSYLDKCLELYKEIGIYCNGLAIKENMIHQEIKALVLKLNPDIVVITGHDIYNKQGLKDISNYSNTEHYINAVKKIREFRTRGDLVVIAGACQSNFEALIASGADFASSPKRINIHTFDPAVIAIKVASTSFSSIVNLNEALRYIDKGRDAFGGLETLGKMRLFV